MSNYPASAHKIAHKQSGHWELMAFSPNYFALYLRKIFCRPSRLSEGAPIAVEKPNRQRIMAWVAAEILPHEAAVRSWLGRSLDPADLDDVIQEAYCKLSALDTIDHIQNGRAYFFTTTRSLVIERVRRSRIVSIEAVADLEMFGGASDAPSPERIAGGRRELARVMRLIEALPARCQQVLRLRKIDGLPQRMVAERMGIKEHDVENDIAKAMRIILRTLAEDEQAQEHAMHILEPYDTARDSNQH
jgi:RNA polymerase sigma factor (sigma-70 family)